jgi:hypothetical protein
VGPAAQRWCASGDGRAEIEVLGSGAQSASAFQEAPFWLAAGRDGDAAREWRSEQQRRVRESKDVMRAREEGDRSAIEYRLVRHARVRDEPVPAEDVARVVVAYWRYPGGVEEWCVEYWDRDTHEIDFDTSHPSEAEAVARAEQEFGVLDWREDFPPSD